MVYTGCNSNCWRIFGGVQANFFTASNPFNPLDWNWHSPSTYIGIASGMATGIGLAGIQLPTLIPQVAGIIPNGLIHAGANVAKNGLINVISGDPFFENCEDAAISGFVNDAITGYQLADAKGLNYFWGTTPAPRRSQWSLAWWEKPEVYKFPIKNLAGNINNGCTYCTMTSVSKSYDIKGQNQEYWRKSYENFIGNNNDRPTSSNFREWLKIEGYNVNYISYTEIPQKYIENKRVIAIVSMENGQLHMMPLKKAKFYNNGNFKLIFMDPNGGGRYIIKQKNFLTILPALYEIYR